MFGQINYLKHYSNNGYDAGQGIVQLDDSSYVICGKSSSFNSGPSQAFMMRVDSLGNYIWSNMYGGFESESARRVLYQKNFGFFLTGYTNSTGNGAFDFYMVKTDESGTKEWEKTYGTSGWEKVNDAALTRDTGVIMVGETNSDIATGQDMYIVRTDLNGDTLWTKTFGGVGPDVANCIERYNDSLFIVGGNMWIQDSIKSKAVVIYLKDDGIVIDIDTMLNGNGHWELNDIAISNDTINGIGSHLDTIDGDWNAAVYLIKINPSTIQAIGYNYVVLEGDFWGDQISIYGNGNRRYAGLTNDNHINSYPYGEDLLVARYSSFMTWQSQVAQVFGDYPDRGGEIIPTSDGGAAMTGYREGIGEGGGSVFLLKIGPGEVYPTTLGVTSYSDLVAIEEIVAVIDAKIYPNPTTSALTVELPFENNYEIQFANALGQIIQTEHVYGKQTIDVSVLGPGIYTLIFNEGGVPVGSYRLVIQ